MYEIYQDDIQDMYILHVFTNITNKNLIEYYSADKQ